MLATFPVLQPEETVHGIVGRFLDLYPPVHWRRVRSLLLGGQNRAIAVDLPHRLSRLCETLGPTHRLLPRALIEGHTLLPYVRPFVRAETLREVEEAMLREGNPHFSLGIASGARTATSLRLCPTCAEKDIRTCGAPVWRRIHQVASVFVCPEHGDELVVTDAPSRPVFQFEFHAARGAKHVARESIRANPALFRWIATETQAILSDPDCPRPGPDRLADYYCACLRRRGYVNEFGRVRHTDLVNDFVRALSPEALRMLKAEVDPAARDNWLRRLIAARPYHQLPDRHLLMLRFLGCKSVRSALSDACQAHPREAAPVTVRRFRPPLRTKLDAKRAAWVAALRNHAGGSLRERHDALYSWLWRHDRAWLQRHQPARRKSSSRLPWSEIDAELAARIEWAAAKFRSNGTKLSVHRLAVASLRPSLVMKRIAMLPLTQALISSLVAPANTPNGVSQSSHHSPLMGRHRVRAA
ncbi:MAG: TniQ family protein [Opitutaceae bacterium]|nr:TniQ family protein [Opitutaceae bacterium]